MDSKKPILDVAKNYDAAPAPASGDDSFASDYDQAADTAPDDQTNTDSDQDADLDIPAADVTKMQSLKDSGDMAGLGSYVAQFLK
jgi:hypothetical protein